MQVGISKANPDKFHVIKRRLDNGAVTDLMPYGELACSIRNINRPGRVFLRSTVPIPGLTSTRENAVYQELIALRIDGSGELRGRYRRITQVRLLERNPRLALA